MVHVCFLIIASSFPGPGDRLATGESGELQSLVPLFARLLQRATSVPTVLWGMPEKSTIPKEDDREKAHGVAK
jgi:hypothetical protein